MIKIETSSAKMQNMLIFSSDTFERHHNNKNQFDICVSLSTNKPKSPLVNFPILYIWVWYFVFKTLPVFIIVSNVLFHLKSKHGVQ